MNKVFAIRVISERLKVKEVVHPHELEAFVECGDVSSPQSLAHRASQRWSLNRSLHRTFHNSTRSGPGSVNYP